MPLTPAQFEQLYPALEQWISSTLAAHAASARTVASLGFLRLPQYFRADSLGSAFYVAIERCPTPPLTSYGLNQFADFENMNAAGITYLNTFFVRKSEVKSESLFFHELIHVVQWRQLGPKEFLKQYAAGLEAYGYRNSPLEVMAYDAQERFDRASAPFNAEQLVVDSLK